MKGFEAGDFRGGGETRPKSQSAGGHPGKKEVRIHPQESQSMGDHRQRRGEEALRDALRMACHGNPDLLFTPTKDPKVGRMGIDDPGPR